ncbi:MAG TPA: DUF72 domain-containing protein [Vicinamibacterales bacterium]|jgi:uncharacterized protein YecE (DUF72 family)
MRRCTGAAYIGTSGWHYKHWVGPFYPEGLRAPAMFRWYAQRFTSVEINNTFYRLPAPETFDRWRDEAPPGFLFACKASRYITHVKRLAVDASSVSRFFAAVDHLGGHLGPILFQLPPRWHRNTDRLAAFLDALPDGWRYAFEFRDEDWIAPDVTDLLREHGAAYCLYDFDRRQPAVPVTAPFVYVRLHGPDGKYQGRYSAAALQGWAARIEAWRREGRDVYCYFDNDQYGYAASDASRLATCLNS